MHTITSQLTHVRVTLDIRIWDDYELPNREEWSDILGLEGNESVDVDVRNISDEADDIYAQAWRPTLTHNKTL